MSNNLVSFRVEEEKIKEATEICEKLGLDLQSYLRLCISRLINEDGIPFSMKGTNLRKPASAAKEVNAQIISPKRLGLEVDEEAMYQLKMLELVCSKYDIEILSKNVSTTPRYNVIDIDVAKYLKVKVISQIEEDLSLMLDGIPLIIRHEDKKISCEIAKKNPSSFSRKDMLDDVSMLDMKPLGVALGVDAKSETVSIDLRKSSHMLVSGSTGSGKSVLLHSILMDLLERNDPSKLRLILVDPKRVEFSLYKDIPNLLCPIIKDVTLVRSCLVKLVGEMNDRYDLFEKAGVTNIEQYNEIYAKENNAKPLPYIVVMIDEFADISDFDKDVINPLISLLQKSRAAGMTLIISTQRPTTDVLNGCIRANISTKIAMWSRSSADSILIIGEAGAEKLLGHGDMYVSSPELSKGKPTRLQCCYVGPKETVELCNTLKKAAKTEFDPRFVDLKPLPTKAELEEEEFYHDVVEYVRNLEYVSISKLQIVFKTGFPKAGKLFARLIKDGIVEENQNQRNPKGNKVLIH